MLAVYLQDLMQDKQIAAAVVIVADHAKSHAPRPPWSGDRRGHFQRTNSAPLSPVRAVKRNLRGGRRGGLVRTNSESNLRTGTGIATTSSRWDSEPPEAGAIGGGSEPPTRNDYHKNGSLRRYNSNDLSMCTRGSLRRGPSPDTRDRTFMTTSNDKSPIDENDKAFSSLKQNVHKPVRRGSIEKNSRKTFFSPLRKSSSFSLIHNVSKPVRRGSDGGGGGEGGTPQQYLLPPLNLLDDHSSSSSSSTSMSTADLITIALNDNE
jgi:hypothetical protein